MGVGVDILKIKKIFIKYLIYSKNKDILNVINFKIYRFEDINYAISDMRKGKEIRHDCKVLNYLFISNSKILFLYKNIL